MQRLEVSGAVRPLYGSLGVKGLLKPQTGVLKKEAADSFDSSVPATTQYGVTSLKTSSVVSPYLLYIISSLLFSN